MFSEQRLGWTRSLSAIVPVRSRFCCCFDDQRARCDACFTFRCACGAPGRLKLSEITRDAARFSSVPILKRTPGLGNIARKGINDRISRPSSKPLVVETIQDELRRVL